MLTEPPEALSWAELAEVPGVLGQIVRERQADYGAGLPDTPQIEAKGGFYEALALPGLSIIAEVKRSSPSQGMIAALEPVDAALAYQRGGAAAISVLTEPRHFGGTLSHLEEVAEVLSLPLLRKDFTVHPVQIIEALAAGASAVLLIVAVLQRATASYLDYAHSLGLEVLVEVHDQAELDIALDSNARIIGVNNRNLQTLEIDLNNAPRLIQRAREAGFQGLLVAESGYRSQAELIRLKGLADAALVGTSLAGSGDLEQALRNLRV